MIGEHVDGDGYELVDDLFGGLVENDFQVELGEGGDEFLHIISCHFVDLLMEFENGFNFGDLRFFAQEGDESVDILVVVLYDWCVFEEVLFLLGGVGFVLKEGS